MDKLKEQLAVVKQHSFWVMCAIILIVGLASWWVSTSAIVDQQTKQLQEITSVFQQLDTLRGSNPEHPNAAVAQGMDQLIRSLSAEVANGWQKQYDQQAKVLVWPASFDAEFHAVVDKLRPIEIVPPPPTPFKDDIPLRSRQIYRNYIAEDIPTLAKTIGTEWKATVATIDTSGSGSSGYGGSPYAPTPSYGTEGSGVPGAIVEDKSIVIWTVENQQHLLQTHFGFTARADVPSTLEVLYAQEDLWVLQNIMDIIKATNGDAETRHEAVIKQIDFVRIGRSAVGLAGAITPIGAAPGSGSGSDPYGAPEAGAPTAEGSTATGTEGSTTYGSTGTTALTSDPASGRYVDEKYQPLDPTRLRNAYKSQDPSDALLAVAKRMPVRMRFKVDQRRLNQLLAECGNSRLPIEVRQVRLNRDPAAIGGDTSGGGYGGGSSQSTYGGGTEGTSGYATPYPSPSYGTGGGMGGSRPGMVPGSVVSDATVDPNLIDVELYGVVYIYNPVNKSQLGIDQPGTTVAAPGTTTPTTSSTLPVPPAAVLTVVQ
jgi:hypothetical protein